MQNDLKLLRKLTKFAQTNRILKLSLGATSIEFSPDAFKDRSFKPKLIEDPGEKDRQAKEQLADLFWSAG